MFNQKNSEFMDILSIEYCGKSSGSNSDLIRTIFAFYISKANGAGVPFSRTLGSESPRRRLLIVEIPPITIFPSTVNLSSSVSSAGLLNWSASC